MLANSSGRVCCPLGLISSSALGLGISIQTSPGRWLCPNPQNPFFLPGLKGNTPPVGVFPCSAPSRSGLTNRPPTDSNCSPQVPACSLHAADITADPGIFTSPHPTRPSPAKGLRGEALTPSRQSLSLFQGARGGGPVGFFFSATDLGEDIAKKMACSLSKRLTAWWGKGWPSLRHAVLKRLSVMLS